MAAAYAICAFILSLPVGFDSWNGTQELDYYQTNLIGFDQLSPDTQQWAVQTFSTAVFQIVGVPIGCTDPDKRNETDSFWTQQDTVSLFHEIRLQ